VVLVRTNDALRCLADRRGLRHLLPGRIRRCLRACPPTMAYAR